MFILYRSVWLTLHVYLVQISVADFAMYEYLMIMQAFEETLLDGFDWLKQFVSRFEVSSVKKNPLYRKLNFVRKEGVSHRDLLSFTVIDCFLFVLICDTSCNDKL